MRKRGKGGRFLRSRRRHVARRRARARTRTVTKTVYKSRPRYYSRPRRRVRMGRYRAVRRSNQRSKAAGLIAAGIASAAIGATIGALANEAGLLQAAPTQNFLGVSAGGLVGAGLIVIGWFTKSEGMKLLFYGLGGGLLIEELVRQVDMRFYDFRVAFLGAPALDYSQGISGAQLQLANQTPPTNAPQLPSSPSASTTKTPQLPSASPDVLSSRARVLLDTIVLEDIPALKFFVLNAPQKSPFSESVRQLLIEKGALDERERIPISDSFLQRLNRLKGTESDFLKLENQLRGGRKFVEAVERLAQLASSGDEIDSLGYLRDSIPRVRAAA